MARAKFLCDAERCIECNACVTACKNEHEVPWGVNRRRVVTINDGVVNAENAWSQCDPSSSREINYLATAFPIEVDTAELRAAMKEASRNGSRRIAVVVAASSVDDEEAPAALKPVRRSCEVVRPKNSRKPPSAARTIGWGESVRPGALRRSREPQHDQCQHRARSERR